MRKLVSDNRFGADEYLAFNDVYQEIVKKYPLTISNENGKLVLSHRRLKLVQVVDCREDRKQYEDIMYKYADYCKFQHGADIDVNKLNINEMFNCECLHNLSDKYPMFFGYNNKNELIGIFGFRKSLNLKTNSGIDVNLQEISIRTNCKNNTGLAIYGGIAFFMIYAYAMKHKVDIFMSTLHFLRSTMFHVSDVCRYNYIKTKTRYVEVFDSDIMLDLWTTQKDESIRNLLVQS